VTVKIFTIDLGWGAGIPRGNQVTKNKTMTGQKDKLTDKKNWQ